ncbi:MAG TPA: ABC transporter ATP-binding protein [Blastocatellia bacterium]|nr:ABC transporter ATP-binding protein [Blastocatellia bacterium]
MTTSGRVLSIEGLSLRYSGATSLAVDDFSLEADRGEIITLLGPSGCGKTSALRLVAGLEQPGAGRVSLNGKDITGWAPELRRMGFVFQNYALFPHLTVGENVAFGLRIRRASRAEIDEAVRSSLALVNLEGFEDRRIDQLSGGQQQRVALARALAITPTVLLLDEPLSNLDASLREQTRDALRGVLRSLDITTLFVTHDQSEAFTFSDRIVLMRAGRIVETGSPETLYTRPEHRFTAEFLGSANVIPSLVIAPGTSVSAGGDAAGSRIVARDWSSSASGLPAGSGVFLVARVESLELSHEERSNSLAGRIVDRVFLGSTWRVAIDLDEPGIRVRALAPRDVQEERIWVRFPEDAIRVISTGT